MERMLFSPLQIRGITLRNRIVVSPMLTYSADNGHVNDWHLAHLAQFAAGGAGLVFMESTKIDPAGCSTPRDTGLWKDEFVEPLKRITALIKRHGAVPAIQLGHSGRKARRSVPWEGRVPLTNCPGVDHGEEWVLVGPSAVAHDDKYAVPREMTRDDIREVAEAWAEGARRANEAGFDVLEIHGAHGYLIHQFLSADANRRTDEYGGSLENRMRFPLEVARALREAWPKERCLGARISGHDWHEEGATIEDTIAFTKELKKIGFDYVCVSSGALLGQTRYTIGPNYQVPLAAAVKKAVPEMAVRAVGMIADPDQAEEIVASGKADMVAMARAFLDNPRWVWHAAEHFGTTVPVPPQYERAVFKAWQGSKLARPQNFETAAQA